MLSNRVDLAVERERAELLKSKEKVSKDLRNLYLANEGLVAMDHDSGGKHNKKHHKGEAEDMSEADKEKRFRAQTEKKKKLTNPLFFVSPTR